MAEASELTLSDQKSLICNICLDLLNTPVTIPCGHSFCKDCITAIWEQQVDHEGCPQCSQTFSRRPHLISCVILKDLIEKLRSRKPQTDAEDHDVRCDACSTRRVKAIKSCLTCLSSYCTLHTEQHNDLHKGKKHQLIEVTDLQRQMCPQHGKLLELFCRTDRQCICLLCVVDEHKNHNIISASDERSEKQGKLMETLVKFLQKVQDRENEVKELKNTEESIRRSAQTAVAECERIFPEIICSLQKTCCRVKEVVSDKESFCLKNINGLQVKVQQEITDMKMKISEINQLLSTEDHIYFLQNDPSQGKELISKDCEDPSSISLHQDAPFHNVKMMISAMQERLMDVSKEMEIKISTEEVWSSAGGYKTLHDFKPRSTQRYSQCGQIDVFQFGKPMRAFSFNLQYVPELSSVPSQSQTSFETDNKQEMSWVNVPFFKPAVPLPDLVVVSTGEEDERVLFRHRAKLYCFHKELRVWKERGVGDLKILQNYQTKHTRLVMRRSQVLKLCANHYITSDMKLKPLKDSRRGWVWMAYDFAEDVGMVKQFAVRFRLQETVDAFKEIFEDAQETKSMFS
ncbi:uncharacterized protein [Misgurnus anguillicaudatus]|uniref:uncharacterized protein isoform X1 n=1 Tax=Misgurnus anguillicaudatus TaxID=75329 RepID=UPI003CCF1AA8